jgi:hypothetical protein
MSKRLFTAARPAGRPLRRVGNRKIKAELDRIYMINRI